METLAKLAIYTGFGPQTPHSNIFSITPSFSDSTADIALYEKWERSNRLNVMFIKTKISYSIHGSMDQLDNVRDLLKGIDEQFVTSEKALAGTLIMKLSSQRLTSIKGKLEVDISESFLYRPFKISYNTHKDKWSVNELMTMCVQEEGRLLQEQGDSAMLTTKGKGKTQANQKGKSKIPPKADIKKKSKCFFCKKKGHMKKDRAKFKKWLEDKDNQISFVCYESNMVNVNINTWWINSGSTIHISNSLQGLQNLRKPVGSEQSILSGNKMGSHVKAIGTCYLTLSSDFVLELEKTFYVPSFSRKLISVSRLVPFGYSFNFSETYFSLFYKSDCVGNGILSMVFTLLVYKIMPLIVQCMFKLALKDVLLTRIPLHYGTEIRSYLHRKN
ncbi:hypothetical protein ACOSQ4_017320 [Xanthoceras sorbifolium]